MGVRKRVIQGLSNERKFSSERTMSASEALSSLHSREISGHLPQLLQLSIIKNLLDFQLEIMENIYSKVLRPKILNTRVSCSHLNLLKIPNEVYLAMMRSTLLSKRAGMLILHRHCFICIYYGLS